MIKTSVFITYLEESLLRHDVYVLGAQGQTVCNLLPAIPDMETTTNVKRILKLISNRLREGYDPTVMKCYDCSGLIVDFAVSQGLLKHDMTADDLYKSMTPISLNDLKPGDFVFQEGTKKDSNGKTVKYMHHVGSYIGDNKVIECKGRDYGVVKTDLFGDYKWTNFARSNWFIDDIPVIERYLRYNALKYMKGDDVYNFQVALNKMLPTDKKIKEDGTFGKNTRDVVIYFQNVKNLNPSKPGVVGKKTVEAVGLKWKEV